MSIFKINFLVSKNMGEYLTNMYNNNNDKNKKI